MITIDDKEYRNLQEQVAYLTEQLTQIKQSLGNALPDPIPGPQGEPGSTGNTGPQGRTPKIGFGFGPLPTDSSFENGDIYIIRGNNDLYNLTKGDLYKKENNNWVLKLNLVGPQGPVGISDNEVVANPDGAVQDTLDKIQIDGVIYSIYQSLFGKFVKIIDAPASTTLTNEQITDIINGVFINGVFLNYKNPVLFPAGDSGSYYKGIIMSGYPDAGAFSILIYRINKTTKEISVNDGERIITLGSLYSINGKFIPDYPNEPEHDKIIVYKTDGSLEWQDKPDKLYRHNLIIETTSGNFLFMTVYNNIAEAITSISKDILEQLREATVQFLDNTNNHFIGYVSSVGSSGMAVEIEGSTLAITYASVVGVSDDFFNII